MERSSVRPSLVSDDEWKWWNFIHSPYTQHTFNNFVFQTYALKCQYILEREVSFRFDSNRFPPFKKEDDAKKKTWWLFLFPVLLPFSFPSFAYTACHVTHHFPAWFKRNVRNNLLYWINDETPQTLI